MRIGETRHTQSIVLDMDALTAAAASIGIVGERALVDYLRVEVTGPVTLHLIAVVLSRLPITVASLLCFTGDTGHAYGKELGLEVASSAS